MYIQRLSFFPILKDTEYQIISSSDFFLLAFSLSLSLLLDRDLVEIIFRLLRWLATNSVILFRDETPAAAVLDFQKALVTVCHTVGAANRIVIRRADFLAAAKQESLDASLHRYHVHVFPAIVPLHLAFVAIELVIGAANKLTFPAADLVAQRGGATMLRRNLNHPLAASLASQMAERPINVAVASTNWFLGYFGAIFGALFGLLQGRALANVSRLDAL